MDWPWSAWDENIRSVISIGWYLLVIYRSIGILVKTHIGATLHTSQPNSSILHSNMHYRCNVAYPTSFHTYKWQPTSYKCSNNCCSQHKQLLSHKLPLQLLEDALASKGEPERVAHCADLCHGTQVMNSSTSRASRWLSAVSSYYGWLHTHGPHLKRLQPPCVPSVSSCPRIVIQVVCSQSLACETIQ